MKMLLQEAIARRLDEGKPPLNAKKYKHVSSGSGEDGYEYAGDLVDEFTKLHKELKAISSSRPPYESELKSVTAAIGNILGIR